MKLKFLYVIFICFFNLTSSDLNQSKKNCCGRAGIYSCVGCCKVVKYSSLCCGIGYWALVTGVTKDFSIITNKAIMVYEHVDSFEKQIKLQLVVDQQKFS